MLPFNSGQQLMNLPSHKPKIVIQVNQAFVVHLYLSFGFWCSNKLWFSPFASRMEIPLV
uniref:Uncharacterized protein n=1 Tax=Tetranychus urticae TaxID=32264 RepID=T1JSD6_TETUR